MRFVMRNLPLAAECPAGWGEEYEPRSTCHDFGIGELALGSTLFGSAAASATEVALADTLLAAPATAIGGSIATAAAPALVAAAPSAVIGSSILGTVGSAISSAAPFLSVGGTLIQGISQANQASYQADIARAQAAESKRKANEQAALAQRQAITEDRKSTLLQSRARAVSASSGTLATSPTEVDLESDIAGQGRYNALATLYEGLEAERSLNYQADIDLFKADRLESSIPLSLAGTLFSGLSKLGSAYALKRNGQSGLLGLLE